MKKSDIHYVNCDDDCCEKIDCVGRRDYERQVLSVEDDLNKLKNAIASLMNVEDVMYPVDLNLWVEKTLQSVGEKMEWK